MNPAVVFVYPSQSKSAARGVNTPLKGLNDGQTQGFGLREPEDVGGCK